MTSENVTEKNNSHNATTEKDKDWFQALAIFLCKLTFSDLFKT
jgi:hypothetical protein